ncbi:hypothetical protein D3C72_1148960 [compost metagenome]
MVDIRISATEIALHEPHILAGISRHEVCLAESIAAQEQYILEVISLEVRSGELAVFEHAITNTRQLGMAIEDAVVEVDVLPFLLIEVRTTNPDVSAADLQALVSQRGTALFGVHQQRVFARHLFDSLGGHAGTSCEGEAGHA